jgi:[ribosomal protein S18]-alanine N-acetyltransferase
MIPDIVIRAGYADDLEGVMPVMAAAFDPHFGEAWTLGQCIGMLSLPDTALLVAARPNVVVGFAMARRVLDEVELLMIAVQPNAGRQGIGKALLWSVCNWAKENGSTRVFLEVRSGNAAIKLYDSVGFVQIGKRNNYYHGVDGQSYDAITLSLGL